MGRKVRESGFSGTSSERPEAYEAPHAALARRAAAEGIVLLENKEGILPLKEGSKIAMYGAGATRTIKGGTGSGDVNERYHVSIAEGIRNAGFTIADEDWLAEYDREYSEKREAWKKEILDKLESGSSAGLGFFDAYTSVPFRMPVGPEAAKTDTDTAVYVISRVAGEGADRMAAGGDYFLSEQEHQMLADICALYPNVIVMVNAGGVVDLSFMDEMDSIKALLIVSQPGMEGGNAVADVLLGRVSPCGRLTDTWALRYEDYPNSSFYSHNNGNVEKEYYEEDIYVGYRYFDSFGLPVRYGFGEGLSYTAFSVEMEEPLIQADGRVAVNLRVKNTGACSGREVVQIYAALPEGNLEKEARRLCAFGKTSLLGPGDAQSLSLHFAPMDLASYDAARAAWVLEAGRYVLFAGESLKDSTAFGVLLLEEEKLLEKTENICPLQEPLRRLTRPASGNRWEKASDLFEVIWDLSGIPERIVSSSGKNRERDEAKRMADELPVEKLICLATGDPVKGQGSNLGSAGISVPGSAGETSSCALEEGIANIILADGPAGLRLNDTYYVLDGQAISLPMEASLEHGFFFDGSGQKGEKYHQYCTALPVGTVLAQTWDPELLETVGESIGEEMRHFGITLWLAPGMNIHRNPLCGRNFEYYSEDPLVSGKMAAAITRGVQRVPGCGTTIKHFACNNQEDNRMHSDSIVSEQALREIYLRGFGIAIREARPFSIMTSYNLVNGVHSANNYDLCTTVAREEFGFDGVIMTDWTTTEQGLDCTAAGCMRAGNDLVMPGQLSDQENIREALGDGSLKEETLRGCIANLIRVILRSDRYESH
ncbi:MAG: glycoside hydrolase family 3 C-terminal domain-containing protein [Clostridiales bacterium]|nr:glycoside hydrolase family 3 C-terminal domain-containing protein [Clostridiales bacterium]